MTLLHILYPITLLSLACIGYGAAIMALFRSCTGLPIALRFTIAYFLGQSILVALFAFFALGGLFKFALVGTLVVLGVLFCLLFLWLYRSEIWSAAAMASRSWLQAPFTWQLLAVLTATLFLCGLYTMGRILLEGDAIAFYLAAAKLIAHTGRIGSLPGYESFSWVIMTGELLYASLLVLGTPGTGARMYEWLNFLPAVVALYWIARLCDLSARAGLLAAMMALTTSAAIGLFAGGKTDTFAVGPALIAIWFALASWRSDLRLTYIAASGLFCGFAIAAKATGLIVLLPAALLLIYWRDVCEGLGELRLLAWQKLLQRLMRMAPASLPFFGLLLLGLSPFVIKNLIIFHTPLAGAGALASSAYFSGQTTLRLILSYPLALTYGRYWAQLGTLSPLILAFFPLFFLIPREARRLASPLTAMTISTLVALAIWMALMPSVFMPRYILATLLLLGIPAAAGAAYVSRGRTALAATVLCAAAIVTAFTPSLLMSRSPIYDPDKAISYFRDGDEDKLFSLDAYLATSNAVNKLARPGERVLLLVHPRLWLRGDLLAAASTGAEATIEAAGLLNRRDERFWTYLQEKKFGFLVVDTNQMDNLGAVREMKPAGLGFCEIKSVGGITAFRIGEACAICPSGERTTLQGPFPKLWADGNGFRAAIPALESIADSPATPTRSPLALCEDNKRLWPDHSLHDKIRTEGGGRFSHWAKEVYFSASDNSDPNNNGRTYTVVKPE